jgi:hypothetical protein
VPPDRARRRLPELTMSLQLGGGGAAATGAVVMNPIAASVPLRLSWLGRRRSRDYDMGRVRLPIGGRRRTRTTLRGRAT